MVRTLLLADDSITIRRVVELTFSETDVRVEAVSSGREAVERLGALRPDLVLADVVMPEPSGYEICQQVKSSDHPVPVLLLAGTFEPFDEERARLCGADGYLIKPFEPDELLETVLSLLGGAPVAQASPAPSAEPLPRPRAEAQAPAAAERPPDARHEASGGGEASELTPLPPAALAALTRAVIEKMSDAIVREIAWQVVPPLAERIVRERIRELEQENEAKGS